MSEIRIEELQPGMVLAQDAVHLNGRVLLTAGTSLSADHLRMLKAWGVFALSVAGDGEPEPSPPAMAPLADEALLARFRHTDIDHPVIAELLRHRLQGAR